MSRSLVLNEVKEPRDCHVPIASGLAMTGDELYFGGEEIWQKQLLKSMKKSKRVRR